MTAVWAAVKRVARSVYLTSAWVVVLLGSALAALATVQYSEFPPTPIPAAVTARGAVGLYFIAPLVAACSAWTAGRFRRAGWNLRQWKRSPTQLLVREAIPTAVAGVLALVPAYLTATVMSGRFLPPDPLVLIATLITIVAASASGIAIGWWLREIVALPVLVAFWYFVIAFPPAFEPVWLRHLFVVEGCCEVYESVNPRVILAICMVGSAVGVLSWTAVRNTFRPWPTTTALGMSILLGLGAVLTVKELGYSPTVPRAGEQQCISGPARPQATYCWWPESGDQSGTAAVLDPFLLAVARRTGVEVPTRLDQAHSPDSAAAEDKGAEAAYFWSVPGGSDQETLQRSVSALAPLPHASCQVQIEGDTLGGGSTMASLFAVHNVVAEWWSMQAAVGEDKDEVAGELPKPVVPAGIADMTSTEQGAWINAANRTIRTCDGEAASELIEAARR